MSFLYTLPTTGQVNFATLLTATSTSSISSVNSQLTTATASRSRLRGVLKALKREKEKGKDGDLHKGWLGVIQAAEDYLPFLVGILKGVEDGSLELKGEPVFSWRSTLSKNQNPMKPSPRIEVYGLRSDLLFVLTTLLMALSNHSISILSGIGSYELDTTLTDAQRKAKDAQLNSAVDCLCRAAGIAAWMGSAEGIGRWEGMGKEGNAGKGKGKGKEVPIELTSEMMQALHAISLADAESLAIRRLLSLSKTHSYLTITPGPPLPKGHPSPSILSRLHLQVRSSYQRGLSLLSSSSLSEDFKRYLVEGEQMSSLLAYKWLGVDAGENGTKIGEAIGWLGMAKEGMKEMVGRGLGKEKERKRKRVKEELEAVETYLKAYKKVNDAVSFQTVPEKGELLAKVPSGISACKAKTFVLPEPSFQSSSTGELDSAIGDLQIDDSDEDSD
ncbi:hypothetical protein BT69DRAFT_1329062 [Atractiella rhizophila]|nr:hypothetical protein BT69DRAFT_1329062 [Atractiella rhizophila]